MQGKVGENRQQEISEISRSLKTLVKEIDVPVPTFPVESCTEQRADPGRYLVTERVGAIEQDADIVMFHRDDYYNPKPKRRTS